MKSTVIVAGLVVIYSVGPAAIQAPPTVATTDHVEPLMLRYLEDSTVVGFSAAVARGEHLIVNGGWGLADRGAGTAASASTVYRLASVSKQFTAALIMRLVERGKIGLGDRVEMHLPDMPPKWRGVTVRQMLNHTSGVPDFDTTGPKEWPKRLPPDGILGLVAGQALRFTPGSKFEYSNSNYMMLGQIAEKLYAKPLAAILIDEIASPLGLASLHLCEDEYGANSQARPYVRDGQRVVDAPFRSMAHSFGSGGVCATVSDLWQWNRALHLGKVVSAESYRLMTTPEGAATLAPQPYGFGLWTRVIGGRPALEHGGTITGFICMNAWIPSEEISITIGTNTSSTPQTPSLLRDLSRLAFGQTVEIMTPATGPQPDARALSIYPGTYVIEIPGRAPLEIRFWVNNGVLMSQATGQTQVPMRLVGDHAFGTPRDWTIRYMFKIDPTTAKASGFTFEQAGATFNGMRKK